MTNSSSYPSSIFQRAERRPSTGWPDFSPTLYKPAKRCSSLIFSGKKEGRYNEEYDDEVTGTVSALAPTSVCEGMAGAGGDTCDERLTGSEERTVGLGSNESTMGAATTSAGGAAGCTSELEPGNSAFSESSVTTPEGVN
ncbi:hypothetical protein [Rhizobium leguminosarum]|uniref:hypothetical protein n=1 Tax=Rhizobium leguminosarum TaxID=384 RepID=UPI001AE4D609|nr:hypothetical protein [Rhizobium leguminosarum]MBP2448862.1 hypothetical protein [Rhizobium leguminosarum]